MTSNILYQYTGRDGVAVFYSFFWIFIPGGVILGLPFISVQAFIIGTAAFIVIALGLTCQITVTSEYVRFVRRCYFLPYSSYSGREIESVRYDGDWGDEEGSCGVVVTIDNQEIHIGARKRMNELHTSLFRLSNEFRMMESRNTKSDTTCGTSI